MKYTKNLPPCLQSLTKYSLEKPKIFFFLMAVQLRGGGGALVIKKKVTVFGTFFIIVEKINPLS